MLDLVLLDFDEVLMLTSLLVDLYGVLFKYACLGLSELAGFISLLVHKLLVTCSVLKHLL